MLLESVCATSIGLVLYHHVCYPLALRALTRVATPSPRPPVVPAIALPAATLIVPVYNEAAFIRGKILDCAALDYPRERLSVLIICDGCTDATADLARSALAEAGAAGQCIRIIEHAMNRGKVAVLNEAIEAVDTSLVALSDASARLAPDALRRAAAHFLDARVGFVTGAYDIGAADARLAAYWRYQNAIKRMEGRIDTPIGAHGAFYAFRREAWSPLDPDTINDDVLLPMSIVQRGFRGVYDASIRIVEADRDSFRNDLARRERLGAGAIQQALRLWRLADPRRPGLAFVFLSGKALRAFMPFILAVAYAASLALAGESPLWRAALAAQVVGYGLGVAGLLSSRVAQLRCVGPISYIVAGYGAALTGATKYLAGGFRKPWRRAKAMGVPDGDFLDWRATLAKRALDIVVASLTLVILAILIVPIAIAIKLDSPGPIFYRQLRVGLRTSRYSRLFYLTKFRTMRTDAELASGAVWATDHDPRITRVGRFMRKTRLDELPQCIDVLRGDMSIVGPRPERPQFFPKLESAIPFYSERTYGLKPGITGLAQVTLPYDSSIEDVRAKVLHDHAYALRVAGLWGWLRTDLEIILRTFTVMVLGKGR